MAIWMNLKRSFDSVFFFLPLIDQVYVPYAGPQVTTTQLIYFGPFVDAWGVRMLPCGRGQNHPLRRPSSARFPLQPLPYLYLPIPPVPGLLQLRLAAAPCRGRGDGLPILRRRPDDDVHDDVAINGQPRLVVRHTVQLADVVPPHRRPRHQRVCPVAIPDWQSRRATFPLRPLPIVEHVRRRKVSRGQQRAVDDRHRGDNSLDSRRTPTPHHRPRPRPYPHTHTPHPRVSHRASTLSSWSWQRPTQPTSPPCSLPTP